jgi:hypothetical protein
VLIGIDFDGTRGAKKAEVEESVDE